MEQPWNNFRRPLLLSLTVLSLLACSCGSDPGPAPQCSRLPVCESSWATDEEAHALALVEAALLQVEGWTPCYCVAFAHGPEEARAAGLPASPKDGRTDGFARGCCNFHSQVLVVRTYGDAAPYTVSLLIHEAGHAYGYKHPPQGTEQDRTQMHAWEKTVREVLSWTP